MKKNNHKLLGIVVLIAALIFTAGCSALEALSADVKQEGEPTDIQAPTAVAEGTYLVTRVVDGDTIELDYAGVKEKVRMIGIDTPESVHPDQAKNTDYGKISSEFTKENLEGQYISLEFDVEERDKYGRLLAYVYLDDEMFNATLLQQGHAMVYTFPPNVAYADYFLELQTKAREDKLGLWANFLDSGEYVASINSSKYHYASCSSAATIKEENKIWFADKATAEDMGYSPCSRCNP